MTPTTRPNLTEFRARLEQPKHQGASPLEDMASELMEAFGAGCCQPNTGSRQQWRQVSETARRRERRRISQELHDGLAPALYMLNMRAGALSQRVEGLGMPDLQADVKDLQRTADAVSRDLRELLHLLRGGDVSAAELLAKIEGEVLELPMRTGTEVELRLCEDVTDVSSRRLVQILRIVQEGIINIEKHAAARRARVILERCGSVLSLTIQDNGRGFDEAAVSASSGSHFGLKVIRERVASLGGVVRIRSAPGCGTSVHALLPMHEGEKLQRCQVASL